MTDLHDQQYKYDTNDQYQQNFDQPYNSNPKSQQISSQALSQNPQASQIGIPQTIQKPNIVIQNNFRKFVNNPQTILPFQRNLPRQPLHYSATQYVQSPLAYSSLKCQQSSIQREIVKGESRIEYIPYEKSLIEYEPVQRTEYIPKEKKVTDYYAVEYQTQYIPQVYQDRYIEYIPQQRVKERIEYQAIQKQIVHQPAQEVVQQQAIVQQPIIQQQAIVQQPVIRQSLTTSSIYVPQARQAQLQSVRYAQRPLQNFNQVKKSGFYQGQQGLRGSSFQNRGSVKNLGSVPYSVVEQALRNKQKC